MKPSKVKFIEPKDVPPLVQEAISIFHEAGWEKDAGWLGALALSVFSDAGTGAEESVLGECAKLNIESVARVLIDPASPVYRDRALLIAFVRMCGCGGSAACLWRQLPVASESDLSPKAPAGLEEWRRLAAEFRLDRPSAKGADFERALAGFGWPGEYGADEQRHQLLIQHARGVNRQMETSEFYELPEFIRLMHVLIDAAGLDLARVIDEGEVVSAGLARCRPDANELMQLRVPEPINFNPDPISKIGSLTNWTLGIGPQAVSMFFPAFAKCKNDDFACAMAHGVRDAVERWLVYSTGHPTYFGEAGQDLSNAVRPYFDRLHACCVTATTDSVPNVRRAWLWFAWCTFDADPNSWECLDPKVRDAVLRAANEDLSRVRKLLARAKPRPLFDDDREAMLRVLARSEESLPPLTPADFRQGHGRLLPADADGPIEEKQRAPWEEFEWEKDHLHTCLMLLFRFGGVWRGLKPMLLAWRALSTPGVAHDLRYWQEPDRSSPPYPWVDLFAWPINLFHAFVGREQATDPALVQLRGQLAGFCLERLADRWSKTEREEAKVNGRRRTNDDMLERSREWRYCLIRAVGTLGLNPEGKGHRTLRMTADLDPEFDVREAARQGYEQLRRTVELPEGVSPRRAIMSALWWIRQAHLVGLGIQPDPDGAQRTRIKELSRTKENDRVNRPALRQQD